VSGSVYKRRADLVGFINGLPLLFIELKKSHGKIEHAYKHNLKDYKKTVPQLFWYNALIILSNGSQAKPIVPQLELLLTAKGMDSALKPQTVEFLKALDGTLHQRLAKAGLIEMRKSAEELKAEQATVGLSYFTGRYIESRTDAKIRTVRKWKTTQRLLKEFLGADTDLATVTAGDAHRFKLHLMKMKKKDGTAFYSPSTLGKHIEGAKLFFTAAMDDAIRSDNPFAKVKGSKAVNEDRVRFISQDDIRKCIEATPDPQWKLILGLSRFGGLRTPSEHVRLRWEDILWDQNKIVVHSPKTEHHEGRAYRHVPLFPELLPFLLDAAERADDSGFVVTKIRDCESNLRTTFLKIIKRAGLKPWPKLLQNLRASRQTELQESYPTHVVCAWMGNGPKVAQKHYLQVTEAHFEKAQQKAQQQPAATPGNAQQSAVTRKEKTPENAGTQHFPGSRDSGGGIRTPDTRIMIPLL